MAGNIQNKASLGDLGNRGLGPRFEEVFEQNFIRYDGRDVANQLFSFLNTDKSTLRTTGLTGHGLPEEFEEGTPFPETSNIKTFETLYSIRDYGITVTVTDNLKKDEERLGKALDQMANHAKSVDVGEVKSAFQLLNTAASTAAKINGTTIHRYNSEAIFSATHARADGGSSQSNLSAGNIPLTELNLETGRLALVKQLTDNGLPSTQTGQISLAVPDDLEKNAVIFTGSQLRATTANNDLNFYRGRINVVSARWLNSAQGGSSTAWYLVVSMPGMPGSLRIYRKDGPEFFASERDSKTWNRVMSVKNRYAVGNAHWLGLWYSAGA